MEKERNHAQKKKIKAAGVRPIKVKSFTRDEIDRYWRMRRMIEEEHLLFAEKAAARLRAKALKEEDHRRFEELLKEMLEDDETEKGEEKTAGGGRNKEQQIGIKDWWTKSKYAYLNQPAIKSMGESWTPELANSTYVPQKTCSYLSPATAHFCATSFGVH